MGKLIVIESISLDGVMQSPGTPDEDSASSFSFGGWLVPYFDKAVGETIGKSYEQPFDLVLGRKTYDIFVSHWARISADPEGSGAEEGEQKMAAAFESCIKYVASRTAPKLAWNNTQVLDKDLVRHLHEIKKSSRKNLLVPGSGNLVQTLVANDLVDELHLHIAPVVLGKGKRLFDESAKSGAWKNVRTVTSPSGVVLANYVRDGDVKTGSFALPS